MSNSATAAAEIIPVTPGPGVARRPSRTLWTGGGVAALIGAYVGLGLSLPTVVTTAVGTRDGVVRVDGIYELPWTGVVIRRTSTLVPSPVSLVLARHGVGRGEPRRFAAVQLADGHTPAAAAEVFDAVRSPDVAAFLDAVLTWADRPTGPRWVERTLSAATATRVRFAVTRTPPPPAGFADRAAFQAWWRSAEPKLEETMAAP